MGLFSSKSLAEKLAIADKNVRNFARGKKKLSRVEHVKFRRLLKKRANAMSDVLGVKIYSIAEKGIRIKK